MCYRWLGSILLLVPTFSSGQTMNQRDAERFARDLIGNTTSLQSWFDTDNLRTSRRLRIEYEGVGNKHLIAYDIDDTLKSLIKSGRIGYSVNVDSIEADYARLTLTVNGVNAAKEFYFRKSRCISPFTYLARRWTIIESAHFRFLLSDSTLSNPYCIKRLEEFLTYMAGLLGLRDNEMRILQKEKILYYLCRDEDEIQRMTGFRARGMCNLAYDAVITTYNNHYHELLHLLINYKLHRLPLYTHPFLQEGFAVAYGGRGGMESRVLLQLGTFLYASQYAELSSLLTKRGFEELDASLSYPAAGLYNRFLLETIGIDRYLSLYRKHSGTVGSSSITTMTRDELPDESSWQTFVNDSTRFTAVTLGSTSNIAPSVFGDDRSSISEDSIMYYLSLTDNLLLRGSETFPGYSSKVFRELFPRNIYNGEQYLVRASAGEISVYNLFTNNLVANYAASFSLSQKTVPQLENRFLFGIRKDVFDETFRRLYHRQ